MFVGCAKTCWIMCFSIGLLVFIHPAPSRANAEATLFRLKMKTRRPADAPVASERLRCPMPPRWGLRSLIANPGESTCLLSPTKPLVSAAVRHRVAQYLIMKTLIIVSSRVVDANVYHVSKSEGWEDKCLNTDTGHHGELQMVKKKKAAILLRSNLRCFSLCRLLAFTVTEVLQRF